MSADSCCSLKNFVCAGSSVLFLLLPSSITPMSVQKAFSRAQEIISSRNSTIYSKRRFQDPMKNIPSAWHQRYLASNSRSRMREDMQEQFEEATRVLQTEFNLTTEQIPFGLEEMDLASMLTADEVHNCMEEFDFLCALSGSSRSHRGFCNNLVHPSWGMASSCFERLVEPDYADGISEKRVAASGNPLPSPRRISLELHSHFDNPMDNVTHMFMAWGQFLGHDISLSPLSRVNNETIECCPVSDEDPPQCDPILIARDDPFYSAFGIDCLSNVRSMKCLTCSLGPRQQINQVTSYIDASHIYSLDRTQNFDLRNYPDYNGTFRSVFHPQGGELPPGSYFPKEDLCSFQDPNLDCFETGDHRANQHPALTSLHVLFLREHNRIARKLKEMNCWWTGAKINLHTRRIVGAIMQHITYNEFLPLVIGPEKMEWFDLSVLHDGFTQYDNTVKATLVNEFSTAAYRFGHSMINSFFPEINKDFVSGSRLRDMFQYPFGIYRGQLDRLCAGLINSSAQMSDRRMVRDVTNHLFQPRWKESGLDLAALNVNRGRDHGIPGYTTLLEFCGGPKITSWNQLDQFFQRGLRPRFQRIYEDVRDIDLFSGGLAERPIQGAVVGPTFACIIGIQFYHLKYGDRFFFEHGEQGGSFTAAQLKEIKKMTLAKLMCQNSGLEEIQPNVMQFPSKKNAFLKCDDLPEMDLNLWIQPLVNCSDWSNY
ncbi:peroxidasin [Trichonephila inaurata madagascariensis]|uniref:Peroxidasin n=1 Tax=Trichonephila inaurata madagascariensis TaxID=2747483 RepID=A0A8X6YX71_9ARAC|nr:peroxidasin [Trichonephila inaurata madagascariensis]